MYLFCLELEEIEVWVTKIYIISAQPGQKKFQDRRGLVELGHFDKNFVKNTRKKALQEKTLKFFFLDTLKTIFWVEKLTQ